MNMGTQGSPFESSEILASFIASSPLLSDSWTLCSASNANTTQSYLIEQVGNICYVAFSALQNLSSSGLDLIDLESVGHGLFSPLVRRNEEEKPVMVLAGILDLFFTFYPNLHNNQIMSIMRSSNLIVFTGHSIGGALASLSTLWLLSYLHIQSSLSPVQVLCVTFGSPLLGNVPLSNAILRERWGANFCHVTAKHDIMPRLLFAPMAPQLHSVLRFLQMLIANMAVMFPDEQEEVFKCVLARLEHESSARSLFWPFGSYLFVSEKGGICLDNAAAITKMMHLMLKTGSPISSIEDHLKYQEYVHRVSNEFFYSTYEAGGLLALGISNQDMVKAKDCLIMARRMGRTPNLNSAELAIKLSAITPHRAQIEWYKERCDASDEQMGYYDCFKRGALKRDNKVNMFRLKLGNFWDKVIEMLEKNELPHDFHRHAKWVNSSQFYKLLAEPLDIADYYKTKKHLEKGHYLEHGRERRYEIFDRWWRDNHVEQKIYTRSTYASSTQDSCFWARVEKAKDYLHKIRSEINAVTQARLWEYIIWFENYASGLVERKEVSIDVLAKNSSYSVWVEELKEFKLQASLNQFQPCFQQQLE